MKISEEKWNFVMTETCRKGTGHGHGLTKEFSPGLNNWGVLDQAENFKPIQKY